MRSIRFIVDDHIGSTLPLAKEFARRGNRVQYVYLTAVKKIHDLESTNIQADLKYGVNILKKSPSLNRFLDGCDVEFVAFRYFRPFERYIFLRIITGMVNTLFFFCYRSFFKASYDFTNIVGRYNSNVFCKLISYLSKDKTFISLHEVNNHFTKDSNQTKFIKTIINHQFPLIFHSQNCYSEWDKMYPSCPSLKYHINFGVFEGYRFCDYNRVLTKEPNYFLFFGYLKPYKGLNNILSLLEHFKDLRTLPIVIAGNGDSPHLQKLSAFPNVQIINRYLSNDDLASLIFHSRCVLCPYNSASQSGVILTSFAFYKPVIATEITAFREVIINGKNGYLFDINDLEKAKDAMIKLANDNLLYEEMVKYLKDIDITMQEFSWKYIANQYMRILDNS